MKETQLKKTFTERDLQRVRNLIQKKGGEKILTSIGYTKVEEKHNEGDVWEENGRKWTIKNGIKCSIRKIKGVGTPLLCPKCSKPMNHHLDVKMYTIHQMCLKCVTEFEGELKRTGQYKEYEETFIQNNAKYFINTIDVGLDQILDDMVNEAYVTEDGTIQNWIGNGVDTVKIKQELVDKLQKIRDTIKK